MSKIQLSKNFIRSTCKLALNEDLFPSGDITSELLNKRLVKRVKLIVNENGILGGIDFAKETFKLIDKKIKFISKKKEGSKIKKGIATITNKFVKKIGNKSKICCTRKTIPNLRVLQKYGVKLGGGKNHRFNLSDEFLIKDNHIASEKNFENIIKKAIKNKNGRKITVEVDSIKQLKKIMGLKFDTVLLDNMKPQILKTAVKLINKKYETEASGGVNLKNIKKISNTGVDRISIGCLTHSVTALDFKLEI